MILILVMFWLLIFLIILVFFLNSHRAHKRQEQFINAMLALQKAQMIDKQPKKRGPYKKRKKIGYKKTPPSEDGRVL